MLSKKSKTFQTIENAKSLTCEILSFKRKRDKVIDKLHCKEINKQNVRSIKKVYPKKNVIIRIKKWNKLIRAMSD